MASGMRPVVFIPGPADDRIENQSRDIVMVAYVNKITELIAEELRQMREIQPDIIVIDCN